MSFINTRQGVGVSGSPIPFVRANLEPTVRVSIHPWKPIVAVTFVVPPETIYLFRLSLPSTYTPVTTFVVVKTPASAKRTTGRVP